MARAVRSSGRAVPVEVWAFLIAVVAAVATLAMLSAQQGGPVTAYAFSEGSGATAADSTGRGHTALLGNGPMWSDGRFGSGLAFDGVNDGVEIVSADTLQLTDEFTVAAWVKPLASGWHTVVTHSGYCIDLQIGPSGTVVATASLGGALRQAIARDAVSVGTWVHVAMTYDGATLRLYLDGTQRAATTFAGSLPVLDTLRLGTVFTGVIDEARVYDRALSAGDLALALATPVDAATPFQVSVTRPARTQTGVVAPASAVFSAPVDPATLDAVRLEDSDNVTVLATVSYDAGTRTATIRPDSPLAPLGSYTAIAAGGINGVRDTEGRLLTADRVWTFQLAADLDEPSAAFAFSEGTGQRTLDGSGNGNVATLLGGTSWTTEGAFGGGLAFDSSSDRVRIPPSETLALGGTFTLEAWVKPASTRDQTVLMQQSPDGVPGFWGLYLAGGDLHPYFAGTLATGAYIRVDALGGLPLDVWSHVALSYDSAAATRLRLYINGSQAAASAATSGSLAVWPEPLWIGGAAGWSNFHGAIDDVRIYRRALSASEIVDDLTTPVDDAAPFGITQTSPVANAAGAVMPVRVTFSRDARLGTVTSGTIQLRDAANTIVPAAVGYDVATRTATLTPTEPLAARMEYSAHVTGGTEGVLASDGAPMPADVVWRFRVRSDEVAAAFAFSEGTGTATADHSGNGNTGRLIGGPAWSAAGRFGGGLLLDGTSARAEVPPADAITLADGFTLEAWVMPSSTARQTVILRRPAPGEADFFELSLEGGDLHPVFAARLDDGSYVRVDALQGVPLNEWSHLAVTYDGAATTRLRLYVNGEAVASHPAVAGRLAPSTEPICLGGTPGWDLFEGGLDEVRIFSRARTQDEIRVDRDTPVDPEAPFGVTGMVPGPGRPGAIAPITARFSRAVNALSVTANTIRLLDSVHGLVDASVGYDPATRAATVTPASPLLAMQPYTVRVTGGSGGVTASDGGLLGADVEWTFVTAAADTVPSAAYAFAETAGLHAADLSGNGNTALLVWGAAWNEDGGFGRGLILDGNDGRVQLPPSDTLDLADAFTLEAWVKPSSMAHQPVVLRRPAPGAVGSFELTLAGGHLRPYFAAVLEDGSYIRLDAPSGVPLNQWTHLALTYDSAASPRLRLFVNGVLEVTAPATAGRLARSSEPIWLGGLPGWGLLAGGLDDVRIYRRAIGEIAIVADMATSIVDITPPAVTTPCVESVAPAGMVVGAAGATGIVRVSADATCVWSASTETEWLTLSPPIAGYAGRILADGAVGYWRLDEAEGPVVNDHSGQGRNGEVQGSATHGLAGAIADGNAAMRLDDAFVLFSSGAALFGGPTSIESWVRIDGDSNSVITSGAGWSLSQGSQVRFRSEINEFVRFDLTSSTPLADGAWHHVVAVYAPADGEVRLFIDGALDSTGALAAPLSGTRRLNAVGAVGAAVDELAIYQSALTAEQVAAHYLLRLSTGGGAGSVAYTASANPLYEPRVGSITVAGIPVTMTQEAAPCYQVTPGAINAGSGGASGVITLTALASGCSWTASTNASWITVGAGSGTTSADVSYAVSANPFGTNRSSTITIAGTLVMIQQVAGTLQRPPLRFSAAAGRHHTLALQNDGTVWSWGRNDWAQLGDGTTANRSLPVHLTAPANVVALAAGDRHSLALTATGAVWAWGANGFGQLGDGSVSFRTSPVQVNLTNVVALTAGADHAVALKGDGTVWVWGLNSSGQLGDGTTVNRTLPTRVAGVPAAAAVSAAGWQTLVIDSDGRLWAFGDGISTPVLVPADAVVTAAGGTFALAADGDVWAWGPNGRGRLGDGTVIDSVAPRQLATIDAVAQLAIGDGHAMALRSDGTLWSWGGDEHGQLGRGTAPCPVSSFTCFDQQYSATPVLVSGPSDVARVAAGANHTIAVTADGEVWTWGRNDDRQLGDGSQRGASVPLKIAGAGFAWHTGTPILTAGGKFSGPRQVTAVSATVGAVIRYTTDGRDPDETDAVMPAAPEALTIAQTTVLTVRAFATGRPPSRVISETFAFIVPRPAISPAGGTYASAQTVTMTPLLAGSTIRYTTDGTVPTVSSPEYSEPLTIGTGTTLSARGFKEGWTPSELTSLSYRMNFGVLAAPVVLPASGSHPFGASVTITGDPAATIHFTMDGSTPTSLSPVYAGAFQLTGPLTIRAAAFHPDWSRSLVATSTLTVASETPSCVASISQPGLAVAAEGGEGELTVTLDTGCQWNAAADVPWIVLPSGSREGSGAIAFAIDANATGAPRSGIVTVAGVQVPVSQSAVGGVTIVGTVSPPPGASGWNRGPVTVLFTCAGAGTITCPAPATRAGEGEHDVLGQATSDLGGSASTTVHVRIDETAPFVSIASPASGELVDAGPVIVTGTAADVLSSVSTMTCDGMPAVMTGFGFSCEVTLAPGASTIVVRATDTAGNLRVVTLGVSTAQVVTTAPPTSLRITPEEVTMFAGETRSFRLTDNRGRAPADAEWMVDDVAVAAVVSTDSTVRVTAIAAGDAELTATWKGLTAHARVHVLAAVEEAEVVKLWSAPPVEGAVNGIVQGASTFDGPGRIYVWEGTDQFFDWQTLRAFEPDGRTAWSATLPGKVLQLSGDPGGGVVALVADYSDGYTTRLMHFPFGGSARTLDAANVFAIHPDGPLYLVDSDGVLTGIDIGFGAGTRVALPGARHGTPSVLADGSVVVPELQGEEGAWTMQLAVLGPDGNLEVRATDFWSGAEDLTPLTAVPNGRGGFLVQLQGWTPSAPANAFPYWAEVVGIDAAGVVTGNFSMGDWWGDLVVAEDGVVLASTYVGYQTLFGSLEHHLGMLTVMTDEGQFVSGVTYPPAGSCTSWDFINYANCPGRIDITSIGALGNGGTIVGLSNGQVLGAPAFTRLGLTQVSAVGDGTYVGTVNGSLTRVTGPALPEPKSPWPGARGGGQAANAAARPGTGILVKGHRVPFTPYNHASIRVAPTNIGRWYEGNPDLFYLRNAEGSIASPNIDSYGNRFFTFGAGPDAANDTGSACLLYPHQIIGTLAGGINRPADVRESPAELARAHYSPLLENLLIERLLASNARYKNDLGYACLPEFEAPGYNSNSYAAGLLNATRIAPPSFPLVRQNGLPCGGVNPVACEVYPGWTKPVPADSFR